MFTVTVRLFSKKILLRLSIIICLGTGFMAGSPFGSASPFFVNVPTPSPAKKLNSSLSPSINSNLVLIRMPSVTSGSSPASFLTQQIYSLFSTFEYSIGILSVIPYGKSTSTIRFSFCRYRYAAPIAAAVAVVPVVNPYLCVYPFLLLNSSIVIRSSLVF